MPTTNLVFDSDIKARLIGELDYSTINGIIDYFASQLKSNCSLTVDLKEVINAKTVVLSLLLELIRKVHSQKSTIKFTNIPDNLLGIAKLNDIDDLI